MKDSKKNEGAAKGSNFGTDQKANHVPGTASGVNYDNLKEGHLNAEHKTGEAQQEQARENDAHRPTTGKSEVHSAADTGGK